MERYDLVVVGTGFAASFFLKKYLSKAGINAKILVLERGVLFPHKERLNKVNGIVDSLKYGKVRGSGELYHNENNSKTWAFDPNFGGSSNCWTGCTPRLMPNDFKLNSVYSKGRDWPIDYNDLENYYCEAESIMNIAGPDITPFPKSQKYPLPAHKLSTVDRLLNQKYGELYISQPSARATQKIGNRNVCCSSTVCDLCPVNSKMTIENTFIEMYRDSRITLKYEAVVKNLLFENASVKGLVYENNEKEEIINADIIALGANAIFNAHILLSSGDSNQMIGKGITDHRGIFAYLYYDGLDNVGGSSIISANGYMLYDGIHRKEYAGCLIESFNDPYIRNEATKWRQISKFKFVFEDIPNLSNRIEIDLETGKPRLIYKGHDVYVDNALKMLKSNIEKYFSFLPLEKIEIDDHFQRSEAHICSTTIMGVSDSNSVVDSKLIHHKYRNLFILGSSVFPSISPSNPSLTISALSLMAADNIFK